MDKNSLQERLILVEQELVKTAAQFNLLEGSKAECLHWLALLEKSSNELPSNEEIKEMLGLPNAEVINLEPVKIK